MTSSVIVCYHGLSHSADIYRDHESPVGSEPRGAGSETASGQAQRLGGEEAKRLRFANASLAEPPVSFRIPRDPAGYALSGLKHSGSVPVTAKRTATTKPGPAGPSSYVTQSSPSRSPH